MEKVFVRSWRALALRGGLSLAFGVIALAQPSITLSALVVFFGAYALLDGFVVLGAAARADTTAPKIPFLVIEASVGIAVGVAALLWIPTDMGMTAPILVWLIATWAIVTGVLEIFLAMKLRASGTVAKGTADRLLTIAGIGSVAAGVLMVAWPKGSSSLVLLIVLLGGYALFFGVVMLVLALRLRHIMAFPIRSSSTCFKV